MRAPPVRGAGASPDAIDQARADKAAEVKKPADISLLVAFLKMSSGASLVSFLVAGLVGAWTVANYGPSFAMFISMYGGDLEPVTPKLTFPWVWWSVWPALSLMSLASGRTGARAVVAHVLAHVFALASALMPFVQLVRLVMAS